jgi:hypothetical protein
MFFRDTPKLKLGNRTTVRKNSLLNGWTSNGQSSPFLDTRLTVLTMGCAPQTLRFPDFPTNNQCVPSENLVLCHCIRDCISLNRLSNRPTVVLAFVFRLRVTTVQPHRDPIPRLLRTHHGQDGFRLARLRLYLRPRGQACDADEFHDRREPHLFLLQHQRHRLDRQRLGQHLHLSIRRQRQPHLRGLYRRRHVLRSIDRHL